MVKAKPKESLALALTKLILSTTLIVSAGALIGAIGYMVSYPRITPPISMAPDITASPFPTAKTLQIKTIPYEIIKDIADGNGSCQDKNIITTKDYTFDFKTIDLNNDKASEIIIDAYGICDTNLTGATSDNHAIYIGFVAQINI